MACTFSELLPHLCLPFLRSDMSYHRFTLFFFSMLSNVDKLSSYNTKCRPTETVYYNCYYLLLFKVFSSSDSVKLTTFHYFSVTNNTVLSELNWKGMNLKGDDKRSFKGLKICQAVKGSEAAVRRCSSK